MTVNPVPPSPRQRSLQPPGFILYPGLLAAAALAGAAPAACAQSSAYALTAPGTGLYRLDLSSRSVQGVTSAGPFARGDAALVDLGFRAANGALYGLAASGDVYAFQQFNGGFVGGVPTLVAVPSAALSVTRGAFSPLDGNLALLGANGHLYTEAFGSGQVSDLGVLAYAGGGATPDLVALAFSGGGTLYGVDRARAALVNLSSLSVVGSLGVTVTGDVGLSFAPDGSARLGELNAVGNANVLYAVDPASGAATLLGAVSNPFSPALPPFTGLAIQVVPEPTTTALLVGAGTAALAAAGVRRRRRTSVSR